MEKLKDHPERCPNCGEDAVTYERITPSCIRGEYVCDECGWGMNALSGKITTSGEKVDKPIKVLGTTYASKDKYIETYFDGFSPL